MSTVDMPELLKRAKARLQERHPHIANYGICIAVADAWEEAMKLEIANVAVSYNDVDHLASQISRALKQYSPYAMYYYHLFPGATWPRIRDGRLLWIDRIIAWLADPAADFPPPPHPNEA